VIERSFSDESTYQMEAEADLQGIVYGQRIIDGKVPGCSVADGQVPDAKD
jgi:hypothetical protein